MSPNALADSASTGWRLRVLRARRGMSLVELAKDTGLDISYLSRLERDALPNAKPKPDTIHKVLDGLGATQQEREAVYHIERPPLARDDILAQVTTIAAQEEESPEPQLLRDERWFAWYFNRAARAALGLSPEEYSQMLGSHMLLEVIDPTSPRYSRVPDKEREAAFSLRARLFKVSFAAEEFDKWYLEVVSRIYDFPWAAQLWEEPRLASEPLVIERQDMTLVNPLKGPLSVRLQMNRLLANPRFLVTTWTPLNRKATAGLNDLRGRPEFAYDAVGLTASALGRVAGGERWLVGG